MFKLISIAKDPCIIEGQPVEGWKTWDLLPEEEIITLFTFVYKDKYEIILECPNYKIKNLPLLDSDKYKLITRHPRCKITKVTYIGE